MINTITIVKRNKDMNEFEFFKNKKLLILAGATPHVKVVEAARQMGITTIVADYYKDYRYSPAKAIADVKLDNNIFDIDELAEYCIENKVDGVLDFCIDPAQKPARAIAQKAGLPTFGDERQYEIFTDKKVFKETCVKYGIDIIPEYTAEDVRSGKAEYPILVKPSDSRGSRGITICYDLETFEKAYPVAAKESSRNMVLIEKYMEGCQDVTISYLVKDGEATLVSLGDRYSGKLKDNLDRQLSCTIQPSKFTDMYMKNVDEKVKNMIKQVGIKNAPIFMQGFADGDTVRMYDPGIRFPGNDYERIYNAANNIDVIKSVISYCVGGEILWYDGKVEGSYNLSGKLAGQYMINAGPGTITTYEGLDKIRKIPQVVDVAQKFFVGDTIENTGDIRHRVGEISILANRSEMSDVIKKIQSLLCIKDENGNNMIISAFDSDFLKEVY